MHFAEHLRNKRADACKATHVSIESICKFMYQLRVYVSLRLTSGFAHAEKPIEQVYPDFFLKLVTQHVSSKVYFLPKFLRCAHTQRV
jgi:hypothetical protein